jgi:hypothetical protein
MIKGLKKGTYSLEVEPFEQFDGTQYQTVASEPVKVTVEAVAVTKSSVAKEKTRHAFEFLPSLPAHLAVYHIGNMMNTPLVQGVVALPIVALLFALMILLFSARKRRNRESKLYRQNQLFAKIDKATDATELLNRFYEAFVEMHAIDLKGIRKQELELRIGNEADKIYEFTQTIQSLIYSGNQQHETLSEQKKEAKKQLISFGAKK